MTLRALTVISPWSTLIALNAKPVENRTWAPYLKPGDYLAIHAGAWDTSKVLREWHGALELAGVYGLLEAIPLLAGFRDLLVSRAPQSQIDAYCKSSCAYSSIVAVAVLDEVRSEPRGDDPWFCGPVGWYLRDVTSFDPVPCKGAQGLWTVPPAPLELVRERWKAAQRKSP